MSHEKSRRNGQQCILVERQLEQRSEQMAVHIGLER
jgi:hypothetical protein